jgi:hypothetical protein
MRVAEGHESSRQKYTEQSTIVAGTHSLSSLWNPCATLAKRFEALTINSSNFRLVSGGEQVHSVKLGRMEDVLGKPLGRELIP